MNRDQKSAKIEEIAAQIEGAAAIFAIDYRGISVAQAAELRGKLREIDASFWVVKNRLTKLAAEKTGEERLGEWLEGPTALTFVRGDTALAAKAISTFTREHDVLTFKGGFMDGLSLDEEKFKSIARLPSREVLDGQLAGIVASPLTGLVRGLGSMVQGLALQLGQIAEKGLVTGEAPAASSAGPDEESDSSSSEPAGEEPDSTPPADDAAESAGDEPPAAEAEEPDSAPPADEASEEVPADETPEDQAPDAEAEESAEPEAEEAQDEAPADEADAPEEAPADDEASDDKTSNDDTSEEEE